MVAPNAEKNVPGLLQNGGALPRNAKGQVSLPGLQHIGARGYDYPDRHEVRVPPTGFAFVSASASSTAPPVDQLRYNVYDAFATALSGPVQPHIDFSALLKHAGDVVERNRQVQGTNDWSSSPKRISELAETSLRHLHQQGCYALNLFEVVLAYALWFQEASVADPHVHLLQGGRESGGDPPERAITDLSRAELGMIAAHLMEILRVAAGSPPPARGLADVEVPSFVLEEDFLYSHDETLRPLEDVIDNYHDVRFISLGIWDFVMHDEFCDVSANGGVFAVCSKFSSFDVIDITPSPPTPLPLPHLSLTLPSRPRSPTSLISWAPRTTYVANAHVRNLP